MKLSILTFTLFALTQTASAYTCYNTAEWVDGEWLYTYSLCPNQEPASQSMLDSMSWSANNSDVGEADPSYPVVQGITYTTYVSSEEYRLRKLLPGGDGLSVERRELITTRISGSDGSVVITETYANHNVVEFYQNGSTITYTKGSNTSAQGTHTWNQIKRGGAAKKVTNGWSKW